ncbi:MAG: hypothetical protein ACO1N1_23960 [Dyadobacter fermentans]
MIINVFHFSVRFLGEKCGTNGISGTSGTHGTEWNKRNKWNEVEHRQQNGISGTNGTFGTSGTRWNISDQNGTGGTNGILEQMELLEHVEQAGLAMFNCQVSPFSSSIFLAIPSQKLGGVVREMWTRSSPLLV